MVRTAIINVSLYSIQNWTTTIKYQYRINSSTHRIEGIHTNLKLWTQQDESKNGPIRKAIDDKSLQPKESPRSEYRSEPSCMQPPGQDNHPVMKPQ